MSESICFSKLKNVAIFGASGAIGAAFLSNLKEFDSIENIYTFSRSKQIYSHAKISHNLIDYTNEATLIEAKNTLPAGLKLDLILITTGALHIGESMPEKSISKYSVENAQLFYLLNTIGPSLVMKHFWSFLNNQSISMMAALCARIGSIEDNKLGGWYSYRSSKAALAMMMKSMSIEVQRRNTQAICVTLHPGTVHSKLSEPFHKHINPATIITPEQSVEQLLATMQKLTINDTGNQIAYNGKRIPF